MRYLKYLKKYNKFNLQTNCRICLTQCVNAKVSLNEPLYGEGQQPKPLVREALEFLTSEKVPLSLKYPDSICEMCRQLLKMAYELVAQFLLSKAKLKEKLKELGEDSDTDDDYNSKEILKGDKKPPVEIFIGSQKFNINDLLIVEKDTGEDEEPFDGFLRNLGNTITASFVKKGCEKRKTDAEVPSVIIEKVVQEPTPENSVQTDPDLNSVLVEIGEIDTAATDQSQEVNEKQFFDEPMNTDIIEDLNVLDEKDKGILESALNLKYKCPYCRKPLSTLNRAKIHSRKCEKNTVTTTCYACGKVFKYRKNLLIHIKEVHANDIQAESAIGKFNCHYCDKSFLNHGSLYYHESKHSGRRYNCEQCEKGFYTRTQLRSHLLTHNRETIVVCPVCGKGFHYQNGLFHHMKIHTNERHLQCSFCPRRFYTRNSLKRHELTHTGARPYSCQYCDKSFRSTGEVKKHEMLHTGERPFKCKYCDKAFIQPHNLKIHTLSHAGSFQCGFCPRNFIDSAILKFHMKYKHQLQSIGVDEQGDNEINNEVTTMENLIDENGSLMSAFESHPSEDHNVIAIDQNVIIQEGAVQEVVGEDGNLITTFYITEEFEQDTGENNDGHDMFLDDSYQFRDEVLVEAIANID